MTPVVEIDPALIKPVLWETTVPLFAGNVAPKILSGDILGRVRKVPHISLEQVGREGDDGPVAAGHVEDKADEAAAGVIVKAASLQIAGVLRGDDEFSHDDSFRAVAATLSTIAEAGGATSASGGGAEELELPRKQNLPAPLSAGRSPDLDGPTTESTPSPAAGETGEAGSGMSFASPVERPRTGEPG